MGKNGIKKFRQSTLPRLLLHPSEAASRSLAHMGEESGRLAFGGALQLLFDFLPLLVQHKVVTTAIVALHLLANSLLLL